MMDRFEVAVIGLGAMGSAAVYHLAKRGVNVLGLDQFILPHPHGSSHGETRVIREAYFEHPSYVPFIQRAYELWAELEHASGEQLYLRTGGIMIGDDSSSVFSGSLASARQHQLRHELLSASQIAERFPGITADADMSGLLEPRAGILFPERCVATHLHLAEKRGAHLRVNEKLHDWSAEPTGIVLQTPHATYHAKKVIFTAGPWMTALFPELKRVLKVERQVVAWFHAKDPALFTPDIFPVHLWEYEKDRMFYGFPDLGSGVKLALHHEGEITNPVTVDRNIHDRDIAKLRALMQRYLPNANGAFLRGLVCLYTNTLDGHFIIDRLPGRDNVIVASPCSGHGFKFASAVGEALADLATVGSSTQDLSLFALKRFA